MRKETQLYSTQAWEFMCMGWLDLLKKDVEGQGRY